MRGGESERGPPCGCAAYAWWRLYAWWPERARARERGRREGGGGRERINNNPSSKPLDKIRQNHSTTEIGQLGGYGFQGVTLGVDGSCKDGRMGSGCCKFGEKGEGKCVRVGREDEGTSSNRPELGGVVLALQSAALNEGALLLCDNEALLSSENGWDREERER